MRQKKKKIGKVSVQLHVISTLGVDEGESLNSRSTGFSPSKTPIHVKNEAG